jgi:WD40 repeat protein
MNIHDGLKPLLASLLLIAGAPAALAADAALAVKPAPKPVPWHVPSSGLRVPVKVDVTAALLRMPPQVYIADLKPLEITGGLTFNPKTKSAKQRDLRKPEEKAATIAREKERYKKAKTKWDPEAYSRVGEREGGPIMRVTGSVTYAVKPEYKYFSWRPRQGKVLIDGKRVPEELILQVTEQHSSRRSRCAAGLVAIPAGAKTLKLEVGGRHLRQAGFITRSPGVAHTTICLPGYDPKRLVPVVYRSNGQRVGCRVVWAEAGEPMRIMFDSSSGDAAYWVYLVDQAKQPPRLNWAPQAELIEEVRQLDRYDPELETLAGFEKLWDASATIVGRGVPQVRPRRYGRTQPARVIYRGSPQFRPKAADGLNLRKLAGSQPATLSRISGTFQIAGTGSYRIFCMSGPGGYVLLDGQLIAQFRGAKSGRLFEMEISKGRHRIEMLQYSPSGQVGWAGLWWKDPYRDFRGDYARDWRKFGDTSEHLYQELPHYLLWEPMVDTTTAPLEHRAPASRATFSWYEQAHLGAVSPGYDLNWYRFSAHAPGVSTNATYRWRFDDGRTAEGKEVTKLFLRAGMRKVQLEVLDAPGGKVIARAAGLVNVQLDLAEWHDCELEHDTSGRLAKIWEFAETDSLKHLPLDDLVNLYEWSFPSKHWRSSRKVSELTGRRAHERVAGAAAEARELARRRIGDMLARRVAEVIAAYPYNRLLHIAKSLSRTENGPTDARYAAAEKLLATVLERAPAGSSHWRTAALALSEIKLSVRGDAKSAQALLSRFDQAGPAVDMLARWQFANAREYHHLADTDKLAGLTAGLDWSPITRPRRWHQDYRRDIYFEKGRGFWLAQTFDLPLNWKGKRLVLNAGVPRGSRLEHVWINGEPLGRMWQWQDRNIVIPGRFLRRGRENRITWLLQPYPWPERARVASPTVSVDLDSISYNHDGRVQLRKGRHGHRDLGQRLVVGVLHDTPRSFAFSPDGHRLASGHQYGSVRLWDVDRALDKKSTPEERKELHTISVGAVSVVSLAFSRDGKRLAAGSEDNRITLLDPASGRTIRSFTGHSADVVALAFSPDGRRLASASHDRSVKIWDTSSGKELSTLRGHAGPVHAVAYSPDGKSVASAIDDAHIRLWDGVTGRTLRTLEGFKGEVLSLAFSPDGKRLAAGDREGVINQWDSESRKKLTTWQHGVQHAAHDAAVTKVLYGPDGKQLASLGGGVAKKWNSDAGGNGEHFSNFDPPYVPHVRWQGPWDGPNRLADGFENYPVEVYTTKACEEQGVNYSCYRGDESWEKLPDFDKLKPVKTGILQRLDAGGVQRTLLPYHVKDEKGRQVRQCSGMKVTGYLRVKAADDFEFSLWSADAGRFTIGSTVVIDSDGDHRHAEEKQGTIHLKPGVHPFTIVYSHDTSGDQTLRVTFPRAFVRSLTRSDIDRSRLMAGTLLAVGKREEAKALLVTLHRSGWPLSEQEQWGVEQTRMRIRRLAGTTSPTDHAYALELIDTSLATYPMLRLDPEFMVSAIAVYATLRDPRAAILAEQMLQADMNEGQRRLLILTQVRIKINAGDLPAAGKVYKQLKKLAPQSDELIEARELIRAAVIKKGKK